MSRDYRERTYELKVDPVIEKRYREGVEKARERLARGIVFDLPARLFAESRFGSYAVAQMLARSWKR